MYNIDLAATYISMTENLLADALSMTAEEVQVTIM